MPAISGYWDKRLLILERQMQRESASNLSYTWDQLRMSVSCPPDTQIHIRSGFVQQGSYWVAQETIWFPALSVDFSDSAQFVNYTGNFTNADYYMPVLLRYFDDYFTYVGGGAAAVPINDYGGNPEYATATEAEQEADSWFDGTNAIYGGQLPLCVVILKNNGITGTDGQVLPIDAVNRGRSYFWRDVRPRNVCPYYE